MSEQTKHSNYLTGFFLVFFAGLLWSFGPVVVRNMDQAHHYVFQYLFYRGLSIAIILICFWITSLLFGNDSYVIAFSFLSSFIGKFLIIGITWSFSFQILSEIRHLMFDLGYGFELKASKISGLMVIFGSFVLTILIYLLGRNLL